MFHIMWSTSVVFVLFAWIILIVPTLIVGCDGRSIRSVFGSIFDYQFPSVMYFPGVDHGSEHSRGEKERDPDVSSESQPPSPPPPTSQPSPAAISYGVTQKEFTALRIEYIKHQILKKLRLKEKPTIHVADLPIPLKEYQHFLAEHDNDHIQNGYSDDFYGKTTQAVIFPYEDDARCLRKIRFPSVCVPFQMPTDIHSVDVSTAELWFHKQADILDAHNQTFVISEVAHWDTMKNFQKTKPIAIQETSLRNGWLKVDVSYVVKNWLDYQDSPTHAIKVVCKTCGMAKNQSPISFQSDLKPFLVIYTHTQHRRVLQQQHHRRTRRNIDCDPSRNECCRESLYVSFAEIGWDDWIIKPDGYNAYFCKGSCITAAALTLSASQHNSILQKVMYKGSGRNRGFRPELTPCCAATQFQPLQLVYMDNNKTLTTKLLSNMIVDACGCM